MDRYGTKLFGMYQNIFIVIQKPVVIGLLLVKIQIDAMGGD